jgi:hypothetical protein
VALVNGVFGWELDTLNGWNEAAEGLAHVLKPGGMLMLGVAIEGDSPKNEPLRLRLWAILQLHLALVQR